MKKAQYWASSFSTFCIYNSNGFKDSYSSFTMAIAVGKKATYQSNGTKSFPELQRFFDEHTEDFIAGYLGYGLNEAENISPNKENILEFPNTFFFIPETLILFQEKHVEIRSTNNPQSIIKTILESIVQYRGLEYKGDIRPKMSRKEYGIAFQQIQKHIQQGDIYEVNLCQEFFSDHASLNPFVAYQQLNQLSPTPFSCFLKNEDFYIISASPERFLAKRGDQLISQPIKGTYARGKTLEEDERNKENLRNNLKDISENVMIVDLVRNDLTKSAKKGTIKVEELLGVYSFPQVHQLISTISCQVEKDVKTTKILENTFPPGSMTGAPKISAMNISKKVEKSARGVYSGTLGYLSPTGDFDFNVLIRSLFYNAKKQYVSYHVGGAITALSNEEEEYQECLLKAEAIIKLLHVNQ